MVLVDIQWLKKNVFRTLISKCKIRGNCVNPKYMFLSPQTCRKCLHHTSTYCRRKQCLCFLRKTGLSWGSTCTQVCLLQTHYHFKTWDQLLYFHQSERRNNLLLPSSCQFSQEGIKLNSQPICFSDTEIWLKFIGVNFAPNGHKFTYVLRHRSTNRKVLSTDLKVGECSVQPSEKTPRQQPQPLADMWLLLGQ